MEIDHIIPFTAGGATEEYNLWLACSTCNGCKNDRTSAIDPITKDEMPIFNPRTQKWDEHFQWIEDGLQIQGITPLGRATVVALQLNREERITSRGYWIMAGWHPPQD